MNSRSVDCCLSNVHCTVADSRADLRVERAPNREHVMAHQLLAYHRFPRAFGGFRYERERSSLISCQAEFWIMSVYIVSISECTNCNYPNRLAGNKSSRHLYAQIKLSMRAPTQRFTAWEIICHSSVPNGTNEYAILVLSICIAPVRQALIAARLEGG